MARVGDVTVGLGVLGTSPHPIAGILVNMLPAATVGSPVTPHFPCSPATPVCCASVVYEGSSTVLLNGFMSTFTGAMTSCQHPILTGATGVVVSG